MVPRQLSRVFKAIGNRQRESMKLVLIGAYQTALFTRAKKLPSLETLLSRFDRTAAPHRDKRVMSWQDMHTIARQWTVYRKDVQAQKRADGQNKLRG